MKFLLKMIALSFVNISFLCSLSAYNRELKYTKRHKQNVSYAVGMVLSAGIGVVTGELVRCIEKELNIDKSPMALLLYIISWVVESGVRNELVAISQGLFNISGAGYKRFLMFRVAQVSSWAMYLREHIQAQSNKVLKGY